MNEKRDPMFYWRLNHRPFLFPAEVPTEKYVARSKRWAFMSTYNIKDMNDPTSVYLRRTRLIQTPWFGINIHQIFRPDNDRDPHDHPWNFATFILRGGYREMHYQHSESNHSGMPDIRIQRWRRWSFHRMPIAAAHRIVSIEPRTVTLVFVGPRVRDWGYWTSRGFVDYRRYQAGDAPDPFDS